MRARLLDATMAVCGGVELGEQAVIDDVIRAAGVSRGTFYKYFGSLEEAKAALGQHLTDEFAQDVSRMFEGVDDPVRRTASGFVVIIARAAQSPDWGAFVARTEHFSEDSVLLAAIHRNTTAGMATGDFAVDSLPAAIDFQMGVAMEGVRHVIREPRAATDYIAAMTTMALRGLGIDRARAQRVAADALQDTLARGPQFLRWWRPLP